MDSVDNQIGRLIASLEQKTEKLLKECNSLACKIDEKQKEETKKKRNKLLSYFDR